METLKQFLNTVYSSLHNRRDSYLELGLALAATEQFESVVALSESPLYRRRFSSVHESLRKVEFNEASLLRANLALLGTECEALEGVAVYSGDSSFIKRSEAKTLEARVMKRLSSGALVYGHETYGSMRLSELSNSWAGVALVERMKAGETVTTKAAAPLKLLDASSLEPKLLVLDAGHGKDVLKGDRACQHTDMVMRLKTGQVFYSKPGPYQGRGRPPLHGKRFNVGDVGEPDEQQTLVFKGKQLRISTWHNLHYQRYSDIHGLILKLEFLNKEGKASFEKPIGLFSTALHLKAETLARAYLWRSSQLSYRFMKQHLGLNAHNSPELKTCDNGYQLVALAMNLLLAARDHLQARPVPWYPQALGKPISQPQAQKEALNFFLGVDSPSLAPRPAGKARGRPKGYHPPPKQRHPVTRKTPKRTRACPTCPFKTAA